MSTLIPAPTPYSPSKRTLISPFKAEGGNVPISLAQEPDKTSFRGITTEVPGKLPISCQTQRFEANLKLVPNLVCREAKFVCCQKKSNELHQENVLKNKQKGWFFIQT